MLTKTQMIQLCDYCKFFKLKAEKQAREAQQDIDLDEELRKAIVKEQGRRARELTRLERALEAEIEASSEGSETGCPDPTASPRPRATSPRPKRRSNATGKKSKKRGDGTVGTKRSVKPANTSRKPGRPRKTAPTE